MAASTHARPTRAAKRPLHLPQSDLNRTELAVEGSADDTWRRVASHLETWLLGKIFVGWTIWHFFARFFACGYLDPIISNVFAVERRRLVRLLLVGYPARSGDGGLHS